MNLFTSKAIVADIPAGAGQSDRLNRKLAVIHRRARFLLAAMVN